MQNEFNKACCYIDDWNLPPDCELKLEQAVQGDRMVLPGSTTQYRLKPAEDYGLQVCQCYLLSVMFCSFIPPTKWSVEEIPKSNWRVSHPWNNHLGTRVGWGWVGSVDAMVGKLI